MNDPASGMAPRHVPTPSLAERYEMEEGRIFLSGIQALVRLPIEQVRRDRRNGLRTRAYITGYPGSPLSGYDIALHRADAALHGYGILHLPGQNEELAATTLMGTQMLDEHPHPDVDGVVGYWYGKGPGIDRSGDALKHGNFAGTSANGAVVILSGEDHEAKSSTVPYQQEFAFEHHGIPVLYPASVQEFIEYGLHAAALSRYSGCWVALKLVGALCDGGEVMQVSAAQYRFEVPQLEIDGKPFQKKANFKFFPGINLETERQLYVERYAAVKAYAAANRLNRVTTYGPDDRIGILSAGKSYTDTLQALQDLGLSDEGMRAAGIRLAKIGLLQPLDASFIRDFARGVRKVIVIEEKRDFLERQIGRALCDIGPIQILGKCDANGRPLFPVHGGMNSDVIAELLGSLLAGEGLLTAVGMARLAELRQVAGRKDLVLPRRTLQFCSGCPHNVSTKLASGQIAWGAPGCHAIAAVMENPDRRIELITQLGGEGLPWIGLSPFTGRRHIVQNIGDGSLLHSSYQNIRFAVSAGVNITFKILFNGVIANTGGQTSIGAPSVVTVLSHLALEGVAKIVLIAREPKRYRSVNLPPGISVRAADALEASLEELAAIPGTTVLLFDGECANERRRRQKRGRLPAPARFTLINEDVCENCGDCGRIANCMSLQKVETEFGAKTQIHQSSCNQDQACIQGHCPSFVTVEVPPGTKVRRPLPQQIDAAAIAEPMRPDLSRPYHVYMPGLGGTGVLTANAILATAASLDGSEAKSYDQTGAAQKWGSVLSSLILSAPHQPPLTNRVGLAKADLYLVLDLFAGVDKRNLDCCKPGATRSVINTGPLPTGEMVRNPRIKIPGDSMIDAIRSATDANASLVVDARSIAEGLFGDYLMTNMVMIGVAYQAGLLPISAASIEAAIGLNGAQSEANSMAFRAGRLSVHEPDRLERMLERPYVTLAGCLGAPRSRRARKQALRLDAIMRNLQHLEHDRSNDLGGRVRLFAEDLISYQGADYAWRYVRAVESVARAERAVLGPDSALDITDTVSGNLHKLMAYKDEYEVARLLTHATFSERVQEMFTGPIRMRFNLQLPFMRFFGAGKKIGFGSWVRPMLKLLARLKLLRGTVFDPFGYQDVRRQERRLVSWYLDLVEQSIRCLTPMTRDIVSELLSIPGQIRGYGHVKTRSIEEANMLAARLRQKLIAE